MANRLSALRWLLAWAIAGFVSSCGARTDLSAPDGSSVARPAPAVDSGPPLPPCATLDPPPVLTMVERWRAAEPFPRHYGGGFLGDDVVLTAETEFTGVGGAAGPSGILVAGFYRPRFTKTTLILQFAFRHGDGSEERFDAEVHPILDEKVDWKITCGNPRSVLKTFTSGDRLRIARVTPDGALVEDIWEGAPSPPPP